MTEASIELDFEKLCNKLGHELQDTLSWQWDSRFSTALGEFKRANESTVCSILEKNFSAVWDSDIINSASDLEKETIASLGGLMPGQLFYTTDPNAGNIVFCAWWPWGNGTTISIRIGSSLIALDKDENHESIETFKSCFGVE
jgi:hypothetical protein